MSQTGWERWRENGILEIRDERRAVRREANERAKNIYGVLRSCNPMKFDTKFVPIHTLKRITPIYECN